MSFNSSVVSGLTVCSECDGCGNVRMPIDSLPSGFGYTRVSATATFSREVDCPECGGTGLIDTSEEK